MTLQCCACHYPDQVSRDCNGEAAIPIRRVVPHTDPARLDRLCDAILEDYARVSQSLPDTRDAILSGS